MDERLSQLVKAPKNGNIQMTVNESFLKHGKEGQKKMVANFAQEAYGHVLLKLQGKRHSHGRSKSLNNSRPENNKELERQIYGREKEAERNFGLH